MNTPSVDQLEDFARTHPYVMFGVLMLPVTYTVTQDLGMALFTGGIIAFGPAIEQGFKQTQSDDNDDQSDFEMDFEGLDTVIENDE